MMQSIAAELWTVIATYVADGRVVCDLVRMGVAARTLTAVPVAQWGGGPERALLVPPTAGVRPPNGSAGSQYDPAVNQGAQVIVVYVSPDPLTSPRPVIIGTMGHTALGLSEAQSEAQGSSEDADPRVDSQAVAMKNAGAAVVLDSRGEITVQPKGGGNARVQLLQGAILRVSRDSAAADYATLAQPMVDAYNALLAEVATLRAALSGAIASINASPVPPTPPLPLISPVEPLPDLTIRDIGSDVLRISSDTPQA